MTVTMKSTEQKICCSPEREGSGTWNSGVCLSLCLETRENILSLGNFGACPGQWLLVPCHLHRSSIGMRVTFSHIMNKDIYKLPISIVSYLIIFSCVHLFIHSLKMVFLVFSMFQMLCYMLWMHTWALTLRRQESISNIHYLLYDQYGGGRTFPGPFNVFVFVFWAVLIIEST